MNRQVSQSLTDSIRTVPDFPSKGIQFKDITPLLADAALVRESVELLIAPFQGIGITKVASIESRGFILGAMIAEKLNAGFVPVRKRGKLPWQTVSETYALEYGTDEIEMHTDAVADGDVVLIHDDVIATGGTAAAAGRLVESCGARLAGFSFLIELQALKGRDVVGIFSVPCCSVLKF